MATEDRNWPKELEAAMNGSGTWFSSHLLRLIEKADSDNRELIRLGFPDHVAAFNRWHAHEGEFAHPDGPED